jgi:hypothetical protein
VESKLTNGVSASYTHLRYDISMIAEQEEEEKQKESTRRSRKV